MNNKKILITGGGGFIGTTLAEMLAKNNELILLDSNFSNNTFSFSKLKDDENIKLVEADILDSSKMNEIVKDVDIIIHLAARLGVQKVLQNTLYTLEVNYLGTLNLLKAATSNSKCERFIFFSTSEVFGSSAFGVIENSNSVLTSIQDARWCYSLSKLAGEHLVFGYYREKGLPVTIIRPFNIFGPRRFGSNAISQFVLNALYNKDLAVYGDGTQIRAWCYVDDFCEGVLKAMNTEKAIGEAFNIGNALNTIPVYGLAKTIIRLSNSNSHIVFEKNDFKDIDVRVPNTAKAREILGYAPKVDLEDGLLKTIGWFGDHLNEIDIKH